LASGRCRLHEERYGAGTVWGPPPMIPSAHGATLALDEHANMCSRALGVLAKGIDTAAHVEALERGGRTVAVIGTGILRTYPTDNKALAEEIARRGAPVSQFWPSQPGARYTFPRRNVVTSGMGQGTVVIEASSTSGAKLQARLAVEHGKLVFLVDSLVTDQPWAEKMLGVRASARFGSASRVR
jgi:predicted Rossmann fold nucleotide-binding protein DprA/Smf involved in DNA uptake